VTTQDAIDCSAAENAERAKLSDAEIHELNELADTVAGCLIRRKGFLSVEEREDCICSLVLFIGQAFPADELREIARCLIAIAEVREQTGGADPATPDYNGIPDFLRRT
jgi:hypothetical protein